jgi:hypothetical protein
VYWFRTGNAADALPLIACLILCAVGGWLLARRAFRLVRQERLLVGVALGVCLAVWSSNLLARSLPPAAAFWSGAALVFVAGALASLAPPRARLSAGDLRVWWLLLGVVALALLFTLMGRGLAIFDDRKNLSIISTMAAGDIPPHFYMNSGFLFKYHYGFQLFGAILMRLGGLFPWSAFDLAKGIMAALALGLAVLWGRRATGRWAGGVALALVLAFASGGRWLITFLPPSVVARAGEGLQMLGSGAQTSTTLLEGLASEWVIEGGPPVPIPFAFVNGILQPYVLYLQAGPKSLALLVFLLLLLLYRRQVGLASWVILTVLFALWALAAEAEFVLVVLGMLAAAIILWRRKPSAERMRIRRDVVAVAAAAALAVVQGGTITEVARGIGAQISGQGDGPPGTLAGFSLRLPPAIVSAHLGELRLGDPGKLLIGLLELGPALALAPLVVWATIRWVRRGRFALAGFGLSTGLGLLIPLFVRYEVDRDITRLTNHALVGWILLALPLAAALWRKGRPAWFRPAAAAVAGGLVFGGLAVLGPLLTAMPRPVLGYQIAPVDAAMARLLWDGLEPGTEVLDSNSWRAVALTGRLTRSAADSSTLLASWRELTASPEAERVAAEGFDYVYVDTYWWESMAEGARRSYAEPCVGLVAEMHDNAANGSRWLYDVRGCGGG